jgi:hypothetical protein
MIFVKRVHVDCYESSMGQRRKADYPPFVKFDVCYDTPAHISEEMEKEPKNSARLAIAKRHVAKYNGTPSSEQSIEDICKMGGLVNPTTVIDSIEAREVARLLWGLNLGMCKTGRVWVDAVRFIPEYLIGDLPKKAMEFLIKNGHIRRCPTTSHIALEWAAKFDDAFSAKYKNADLSFKMVGGSPLVSTDEFKPGKNLDQDPLRCIELMIHRKRKLPVTCTTVFQAKMRPMLIPKIPEPTPIEFMHLRTLTASNVHNIKLILTVSHRGSISFAPYVNKIQMQAFADYQDLIKAGDLFWTERIPDKKRDKLRVWSPHRVLNEALFLTVDELAAFSGPLESCTYNTMLNINSCPQFDSIILVHPLPHPRFYYEAKAKAKLEVKYVVIQNNKD